MMKRLLTALLVVLSLFSVPAMADESSNYVIDNIYIDGIGWQDGTIYVERGDSLDIKVYVKGTGETTDINLKAWIGGYEYDDVQATSEMFDVQDGVTYGTTLTLTLPDDMIAEQDYTLYIEAYDDVDSVTETATLQVSKVRHLIDIQDILVDDVTAGDYTTATVRLENMGDTKEEDIKVTVSIPELDIETSTFMDELTNNEIDNEDEESSGDVALTFQIPSDAEAGDYDVDVVVEYDNGYETAEGSSTISVEAAPVEETQEESTVTVDVTGDDTNYTADTGSDSTDFSTALRLGFGILAVLIVILALILIVRR